MIADVATWGFADWLPLVAIGLACAIYVVREGLELTGMSPGAELLRTENNDLSRRNRELEEAALRTESKVEQLKVEITDLKGKVRDLEMTNQAAVLVALKKHEEGAEARHADTHALLTRAVSALEGGLSK